MVIPLVKGRRGGNPTLFDYPTLNEFLGRPKQVGRPRRGLDANQPEKVQAAINSMIADIMQTWDYRSRGHLVGEAIDAKVMRVSDLRTYGTRIAEYWDHVVTALFVAGQGGIYGKAWPVLLVMIQRLHVAGVSIDGIADHLEVDRSTVRLYLEKWDNLRNPREKRPRSGEVVPGRLVPLTQQEVGAITAHGPNPLLLAHRPANGKWGWMTIKKMKEKDPEAVNLTGRRHRTLSGMEWREIRQMESGYYQEARVIERGDGIAQVTKSSHSRRSRQVRAASANSSTDPGGGSREMLTREVRGLTRGIEANRNDRSTERAQRELEIAATREI